MHLAYGLTIPIELGLVFGLCLFTAQAMVQNAKFQEGSQNQHFNVSTNLTLRLPAIYFYFNRSVANVL